MDEETEEAIKDLMVTEETLFIPHAAACLVGVSSKQIAVYDQTCLVKNLMETDGMSEEEALEYFYYNIEGSYVGEYTPIYIEKVIKFS